MLDTILQLDGELLLAIQTLHQGWLDPLVSFYTKLGDAGLLWIALSLAMLFFKPTRRAGALALCAMILGLVVTNITIKPLLSRLRPWLDWPIVPLVTEKDPNSFPSGHTSASFAAAAALWPTLGKKWAKVTVMVLAALMALSRLYVGVHFPSDVIVGVLVGFFCGWAAFKLLKLAEEKADLPGRLRYSK